jgi:3'(2'), 5'-bisphosphate nucleotidase
MQLSIASLLPSVLGLSKQAGAAIMAIYQQDDFGISTKADASPLTAADMSAHQLIVTGLQQLTPQLPILSEESASIAWAERQQWTHYWLVDPLDGTKEFIKRNGEFTVNIALIAHGVPVLGVVYVPVLNTCYYGAQGLGAWKEVGAWKEIAACKEVAGETSEIKVAELPSSQQRLRVVVSRTHRGDALEAWLARAQQQYSQVELLSKGSSLKICLVAEGKADIYPRLSPTAEWDTAAAQAVLEAAGGSVVDQQGAAYRYNQKAGMLNPYFFAVGDGDKTTLLSLI